MLSKKLLQDYQYLINGHAKNDNPNSSIPSFKSRIKNNIDDEISFVNLDDLDKEYYLKGIGIPQKMVTIGGSDDYKLIDAPNIDWNKTYLFWAEQAKKRGIWNNSPIQNEGRDIRSSFYPDYIWPSCDGTSTRVESYPEWADTGLIQNSDDILDILNYLLWRVLSLDYFADNWDNVNTQFPTYTSLSWGTNGNWWREVITNANEDLLASNLKDSLIDELNKYGSMTSGNEFVYILDPDKTIGTGENASKINIGTLNSSVNEIINALPENKAAYIEFINKIIDTRYNELSFGILTNHPGNFKHVWIKVNGREIDLSAENPCVEFIPGSNTTLIEDGTYQLGQISVIDEENNTVSLNTFVYSIITDGKFKSVGSSLNDFNQNKINLLSNKLLPKSKLDGGANLDNNQKELLSAFDYCQNTPGNGMPVSLSFEQEAATSDTANKFARKEEDPYLSFTLQKVSNSVTGLNLEDSTTHEAWARSEKIFIPLRHNDTDKYEIYINYPTDDTNLYRAYGLQNAANYGIYPHFVIKGQKSETISDNSYVNYLKDCLNNTDQNTGQLTGEFIHKTQSSSTGETYASSFNYGSVVFENGKYYYVPPRVEDYPDLDEDLTIYIYCLLYYRDNEIPRYINPCTLSLEFLLRPDVENKIVFYDGNNDYKVYTWDSSNNRREANYIADNNSWVNKDTTYYVNRYTKQTIANIEKIFVDNNNDNELIDSLYTFYRKDENNQYVQASAQYVANTYNPPIGIEKVEYYLEDNLHSLKETNYSYSVKTKRLSWENYKEFTENINVNGNTINETRYIFNNLGIGNVADLTGKASFSNTVARSIYTKNVFVDFLGLLPSSLLENRETDLGDDANFESLEYDNTSRLSSSQNIMYENEYIGGYYESEKNYDNLESTINLNKVHLNLPKNEDELLSLISSFGVEPTDTAETNGNKKFTTLNTFINPIKNSNGQNIENTGLKVINNTFNTTDRKRELRTNLFNITYRYEPAASDKENVHQYDIEFKCSSAMLPHENGLIRGKNSNGNDVIYNADSDYYYLVFKISCPAGSNFGSAYKECHAYYFIRITRASKEDTNINPIVEFKDTNYPNYNNKNSYITYSAKHGTDNVQYSFYNIVDTPIYLNRCLTDSAISQNKRFKGKQWWFLAGVRSKEAIAWAETNISSTCFTIKNIGENYQRTNIGFSTVHPNWNYSRNFLLEHGMDVRPDAESRLNGVSYVEDTIKEYKTIQNINGTDCELSGPFLYAHNLLRMDERTGELVPLTDQQIGITLGIGYGNDEFTSRKIAITYSTLTIFKKEYDFNIGTYLIDYEDYNEEAGLYNKKFKTIDTSINSPDYIPVFKYRKQFNSTDQIDGSNNKILTTGANSLWRLYRNEFFILSNEFGGSKITSNPEDENFDDEGINTSLDVNESDIFSVFDKFSIASLDKDMVEFIKSSDNDIKLIFNDPNTTEDTEEESSLTGINNFVASGIYNDVVIFIQNTNDKSSQSYGRYQLISLNNNEVLATNARLNIHFNYSKDGKYNGKDLIIKFILADPSEVNTPSSSAYITTGD